MHERCRRRNHGVVSALGRATRVTTLELKLGLEDEPLACRDLEREPGDDLTRTLTASHVPDRELARITPVGIEIRVLLITGNVHQVVDQGAYLCFAHASNQRGERLPWLRLLPVEIREPRDDLRNTFRRHRANGKAERFRVLGPLPAENDLEVRDRPPFDLTADPVKAHVGNVVLPARVETSAHFDVKIFHGAIEGEVLLEEPASELGCEAPRGGNAELAGIGPGTTGDVHNRAAAGLPEPDRFERGEELRKLRFCDEAQHDILVNGGAESVAAEPARDVG